MKIVDGHLAIICATLTCGSLNASAQYLYKFTFAGTKSLTNGPGAIVSQAINERTLLKEIAQNASLTDWSWLALAYHIYGNELGDTIDVVNVTNGVVVDTFMGLYFGQSFERLGLTNRTDSQEMRIDYIYTKQGAHSLGASLVNKKWTRTPTNTIPKAYISGHMDWVVRPEGTNGIQMYSGNFRATVPFQVRK